MRIADNLSRAPKLSQRSLEMLEEDVIASLPVVAASTNYSPMAMQTKLDTELILLRLYFRIKRADAVENLLNNIQQNPLCYEDTWEDKRIELLTIATKFYLSRKNYVTASRFCDSLMSYRDNPEAMLNGHELRVKILERQPCTTDEQLFDAQRYYYYQCQHFLRDENRRTVFAQIDLVESRMKLAIFDAAWHELSGLTLRLRRMCTERNSNQSPEELRFIRLKAEKVNVLAAAIRASVEGEEKFDEAMRMLLQARRNLESVVYNRVVRWDFALPKLKEIAVAVRRNVGRSTDGIMGYWRLTSFIRSYSSKYSRSDTQFL